MTEDARNVGVDSFRVVNRSGFNNQSNNKIKHRRHNVHLGLVSWKSWSHELLEMKTWKLLLICSAVYIFFYIIFTPFYWAASDRCALQIDSWLDAM